MLNSKHNIKKSKKKISHQHFQRMVGINKFMTILVLIILSLSCSAINIHAGEKISPPVEKMTFQGNPYWPDYMLYATEAITGNFFEFDYDEGWKQIGGPGKKHIGNFNGLFGLNFENKIYSWNGRNWDYIRGPEGSLTVGDIYVDNYSLYAIHPITKNIYQRWGHGSWLKIGGPGATFVGGSDLYGLSPNRKALYHHYRWDDVGEGLIGGWESLGSLPNYRSVKDVYVRYNYETNKDNVLVTELLPNGNAGDIYRYEWDSNSWIKIGGPGKTFAVGWYYLWGVSPESCTGPKCGIWQYDLNKKNGWKQIVSSPHIESIFTPGYGLFYNKPDGLYWTQ